jgi:hypothetical protein
MPLFVYFGHNSYFIQWTMGNRIFLKPENDFIACNPGTKFSMMGHVLVNVTHSTPGTSGDPGWHF